jgi:hypothetical protein
LPKKWHKQKKKKKQRSFLVCWQFLLVLMFERHWLGSIRSRAGQHVPILIIGTHLDHHLLQVPGYYCSVTEPIVISDR